MSQHQAIAGIFRQLDFFLFARFEADGSPCGNIQAHAARHCAVEMESVVYFEKMIVAPDLHRTVVFVMTTSTADEDRIKAYNHNVSGYVLKYRPGQTFLEAIGMLEAYWRVVVFPD